MPKNENDDSILPLRSGRFAESGFGGFVEGSDMEPGWWKEKFVREVEKRQDRETETEKDEEEKPE